MTLLSLVLSFQYAHTEVNIPNNYLALLFLLFAFMYCLVRKACILHPDSSRDGQGASFVEDYNRIWSSQPVMLVLLGCGGVETCDGISQERAREATGRRGGGHG